MFSDHVNYHHVVDCGYKAMKDHCYWPIVSDLINLLSHRSVALKFMDSTELIKIWLNLLLYFQGNVFILFHSASSEMPRNFWKFIVLSMQYWTYLMVKKFSFFMKRKKLKFCSEFLQLDYIIIEVKGQSWWHFHGD